MSEVVQRALSEAVSQVVFADVIGVSEAKVSQMLSDGVLDRGATLRQWLLSYCTRLREQAAGRDSSGMLSAERAALARSQRIGQEIKNEVAQGTYAPVGLLSDVLAAACAAGVDRFEQIPALLRKACPDLPADARDALMGVVATVRNEWVRQTADLAVRQLDDLAEIDDDAEPSSLGAIDDEADG